MKRDKSAVVLLSGGLDSAVTLYQAKKSGYKCFCLIFDYGQRHRREIASAKKIARSACCQWRVVKIALPWGGSSLLDRKIGVPESAAAPVHKGTNKIPNTYVPARNIIFLSFALSMAEAVGAEAIFIGAHAQDYSGYPDCRPQFYRAFDKVISTGTKAGVERKGIKIITPLLRMKKSGIVKLGSCLGVPFAFTWSCYKGLKTPCGACDSCYYRAKGFKEAHIGDPLTK